MKICQHLLLNSPPGQFSDVLADLRKIVNTEVLTDDIARTTARTYNIRTSKVVETPSHAKALLAPSTEIDPSHYVATKSRTVFAVDHLTLRTSEVGAEEEVAAPEVPSHLEGVVSALQTAVDTYLRTHYTATADLAGAVTVKSSGDGEDVMVINVCGEKSNLRNFWAGRWQSGWSVTIGGAKSEVSGEVKVLAHYFEDGNIQSNTHRHFEPRPLASSASASSDPVAFASSVIGVICENEVTLHQGLETMYNSMGEETLRSLRRSMAVTRSKMDWNLAAQRMVRNLRK